MKYRNTVKMIAGVLAVLIVSGAGSGTILSQAATKKSNVESTSKTKAASKEKKTYTVSPSSLPYKKKYVKKKTYNNQTKQYFMLRSYLEKIGSQGGGILTLKKGTYKVPCTLYVPSNVTIKLKNGAKIVKTSQTGVKSLSPTKVLFEMISKGKASGVREISGYGASSNVTITGSKNAVIDLGSAQARVAVHAGHASNINIEGITFANKKGGSYIWIDSSRDVNISKCFFYDGESGTGIKSQMAIRLENVEPLDDAFEEKWGAYDKTVNKNIKIEECVFDEPQIAIGSSSCSAGGTKDKPVVRYQTGIQIRNNTFTGCTKYGIYIRGWAEPVITGNTFQKDKKTKKNTASIYGGAVKNPQIQDNTFGGSTYGVKFISIWSYGTTDDMVLVESEFNSSALDSMSDNIADNLSHYYVLYKKTRISFFKDKSENEFTLTPDSEPYREHYTNYSKYESRRLYYVFKSYMEQLEYAGGGVLTIEAGTYEVLGNICVPSNVTIKLKNGVRMKKIEAEPGEKQISKAIFTIVPPSKERSTEQIYGYNGSQNVKLVGTGTVVLDCNNVLKGSGIVMGHAKNVSVSGIQFENEYGSHFIELNSSYNVTVENCKFQNFTIYEDKSHKEAINIDATDSNTNGFPFNWSSHDKTVCEKIYIKNNTFSKVGTAVGSHTYTTENGQQKYHTDVQILNNEFEDTYNAAIRTLNWKNCIIKGNSFKNIQSMDDGKKNSKGEKVYYPAIYVRGTVNPNIYENNYENMKFYPIQVIKRTVAKSAGSIAAGYPDTVCEITNDQYALMQEEKHTKIPKKYCYILIQDEESDSSAKDTVEIVGE